VAGRVADPLRQIDMRPGIPFLPVDAAVFLVRIQAENHVRITACRMHVKQGESILECQAVLAELEMLPVVERAFAVGDE